MREVHARLAAAIACPVITVGGTNGKGSTCALLESILRSAGYRTGTYTSPHLLRYNERVRIGGAMCDRRGALRGVRCRGRRAVAAPDGSKPTALTYFEFGTLAALWLFARARLDALVLEVGLGGRLDAVNVVDADVAVITSIDIDHVDYLGHDRDSIGREKAGIFRAGRPADMRRSAPPASVAEAARAIGAKLVQIGRDYGYVDERSQWRFRGPRGERYGLPIPALRGVYQLANAAAALAALDCLQRSTTRERRARFARDFCRWRCRDASKCWPDARSTVLDVAHNPHAARALADTLGSMGYTPETLAVCAMLADKDIDGVVAAMRPRVDRWLVAPLPGPRGAVRRAHPRCAARRGCRGLRHSRLRRM